MYSVGLNFPMWLWSWHLSRLLRLEGIVRAFTYFCLNLIFIRLSFVLVFSIRIETFCNNRLIRRIVAEILWFKFTCIIYNVKWRSYWNSLLADLIARLLSCIPHMDLWIWLIFVCNQEWFPYAPVPYVWLCPACCLIVHWELNSLSIWAFTSLLNSYRIASERP